LAAACGVEPRETASALAAQIAGAIAGGIDVVQLREPDLPAREAIHLVRRCQALARGTATRIVVNDRIDIAVAAGSHGIHLRETSIATADARSIVGQSMLVGRSVHTPEGARQAGDADYLIAGAVFSTDSKPGATRLLGLAGLAAIVAARGDRPVWAVGGITRDNISAVQASGAAGVAAIGAFIPRDRGMAVRESTQELTKLLRFSLTAR